MDRGVDACQEPHLLVVAHRRSRRADDDNGCGHGRGYGRDVATHLSLLGNGFRRSTSRGFPNTARDAEFARPELGRYRLPEWQQHRTVG